MEEKFVYICEDSLEGVFTAVYVAWDSRCGHTNVEIRTKEPQNLELFCRYLPVATDHEKAVKVARTIRRDLGELVYEFVCYAAASREEDKCTAIYQTLVQALAGGRKDSRVMENLGNPYVRRVSELKKRVGTETERFRQFVRFRELPGGILFAKIHPENQVLELLSPHFSNRYPRENWMIYDEGRRMALIHPRDGVSYLRKDLDLPLEAREELSWPEEYELLWKDFCKSIAVEERKNLKLQQQFVPLKFRKNMLEFPVSRGKARMLDRS